MSEGDLLSCTTCGATFRRAEHLRRHIASHSSYRPYKCYFCENSFKRRDVLRKHLKGCPERIAQDREMPACLSVGKKVSSCDQCARSKKACDRNVPCSTCVGRRRDCTYERQWGNTNAPLQDISPPPKGKEFDSDFQYNFVGDDDLTSAFSLGAQASTSWGDWDWNNQVPAGHQEKFITHTQALTWNLHDDFSTGPAASHGNSILTDVNLSPFPPFDFLLNFIKASGLRAIFNYKRQRLGGETFDFEESPENSAVDFSASQSSFRTGISSYPSSSINVPETQLDSQKARLRSLSLIEFLDDPLFAQTKTIWDCFRASRIRSSQNVLLSNKEAEEADERCLQFFSPPNIRKFLQLFWDEWSPHWPVIHKPTFDVLQTPTILLVSMVLMGAFMSPIAQDGTLAREWVNFGEESVFSHPIFSAEAVEKKMSNEPPLRILQAAYLMCLILNWEGTDTTKRRVRHNHFASVVSVVREIGMSSANHFPTDYSNFCDFDWLAFVQREETIRTFTYVFLLDTAFVIFNNAPPRMVLHEMTLEMAVPEVCFQESDPVNCYNEWQATITDNFTALPVPPLHLAETISFLMLEDFEDHPLKFANRSTLNLFTIVSGIHIVVFQQRSLSMYMPIDTKPVEVALVRWQSLWKTRVDTIDESKSREAWQDIGFIGHGEEFAGLVLARLQLLNSAKQSANATLPGKPSIVPVADGRLDDTSMSVVTDLMLSLNVSKEEH